MADLFKYVQTQPYILAGAGAIVGATSITLKSFNGIDGTPLTMTDFGSIGFGTLEPGNGANEEQISFTGVTHNLNGTATLTGVKNVLFVAPYTQTSGLSKTHAGSTSFVISNTSGFYDHLTAKSDDETVTGVWTFTNPNYPRIDTATPYPTDDQQFATKKYVDNVAVSGAPDASTITKGISKLSAAPTSPTDPIAVGDNDTRLPTQSENDALVGTVGTPSSTNKYVTNDDTSITPSGTKAIRWNSGAYPAADGSAITGITTHITATAGENLSLNDALAVITTYQPAGEITLDNYSSVTNGGNFAVGNHTDRILLITVMVEGATNAVDITGCSYNGSNLPVVATAPVVGSGSIYGKMVTFKYVNPPVGNYPIVATVSGATFTSIQAYSYYNVDQSTSIGFTQSGANNSNVPRTTTITPTSPNEVALAFLGVLSLSGSYTLTFNGVNGSNILTTNSRLGGGTSAILPTTSNVTTVGNWTGGGSMYYNGFINLTLKPANPSITAVVKTNATNALRTNTFVGFANSAATANTSVEVNVGTYQVLSGLTPAAIYYLSDTPGTLSLNPGTITKKIGLSMSPTILLIKDTV